MNNVLNAQTLAELGARVLILSGGRYALPVRFRVRGPAVDCLIPTWSGVGDMPAEPAEVTLVAVAETGPYLRWLFIRGLATVVSDPDWEGLEPPHCERVAPDDLYQLLRIVPKRLEWVDEAQGWGRRETIDL